MRILLVGEYSRLHNSLKEGLIALGHEVVIIGSGDHFKKYPVDIKLKRKYVRGLKKKWKVLLYKLFKKDITAKSIQKQFLKQQDRLKGFDVVQLINESPLGVTPEIEKECISFLKEHNKRLFLLSCGTDHLSVKYGMEGHFRYSIFQPLELGKVSKEAFAPALKYLTPEFKELHEFIYEQIDGVIASDLDYHIPLVGHPKYLGLIPNPINTDILQPIYNTTEGPITIFHGINRANYYKKGSDYFQKALKTIATKYPEVQIRIVQDLPYAEYIKTYNEAHIILDQVLGYDQGYNALEAMAKGKVVFTGAEKEFEEQYQLEERVAINALPDAHAIVAELEALINNPKEIEAIGKRARAFVEREHHYTTVARKYLDTWASS